jgi:elongation factor G
MAFKEAFHNAQPKLMEPIQYLEITVPNDLTGDVMTDLQTRRGIIMGMDSIGQNTKISVKAPQSELFKYSTTLRSLTQGKATFISSFSEYQPVPQAIQDAVVDAHKHLHEEEIS